MQVKWNEINALPVKTWRWMGVNGGTAELTTPQIKNYTGKPFSGKKPAGAEIYDIVRDKVVFMDDEPDLTLHPEVLQFTKKNRNAGFSVRIAPKNHVKEPIVFDYHIDTQNPAVVDENLIVAEEGSAVTVVMHYTSSDNTEGFHCGLTKVIAKKNASVKLVQIQTLGDDCDHFDNLGLLALDGARIEIVQAELGGRRAFANCSEKLAGEGSELDMNAIYLGDGSREIDFNVVAEHFGKRTISNIEAHGALFGSSQKIFRGTIDFKKGSSGSRGREEENTMLLGPGVRNRTAPLILCAEEDVDGHHAASVGHIDAERMFYLMSRGLSELEAKKLLIEAEFEPVTAKIPVPDFREEISDFLKERLNRIESV